MRLVVGARMVRCDARRRCATSASLALVEKRNARERTRVRAVNEAFYTLKAHLPSLQHSTKRVSKLKILQTALIHVDSLVEALEVAGWRLGQVNNAPL